MKSLFPQPDPDTTAWRIYHDAVDGVWVDHFDGRWLVQTESDQFPEFLKGEAEGVARSIYWRPRDKAASTAPEHLWGEVVTERFLVKENGASFWIDFDSGYSSGIFLDQRLNRLRVGEAIGEGQRVLNTFAYTGGFSIMAARAGATTTTIDLSKTYLNWTWDNFRANDLDPDAHFGVKGDAIEWMGAFARKGRTFHGIVLDPPTFSRNKKSTFSTDKDYGELAGLAASLLEPGGWMLCCANTHKMAAWQFEESVVRGIEDRRLNFRSIDHFPMPPEFSRDDYLKSLWLVVG